MIMNNISTSGGLSVLLMLSKINERIMQKHILDYLDKHLSPHLCEYRKG